MLNRRNRFESLIVGSHNHAAALAARSLAEGPQHAGCLLAIVSAGALGKTHLAHSAGHVLRECVPHVRTAFVPALYFENSFARAVTNSSVDLFRHRFWQVDALLVDDTHDLKEGTQAAKELADLCTHLLRTGKRVLVTSGDSRCRLLSALRHVQPVNLVEVTIDPPDFATRIAILDAKAASLGVTVPNSIAGQLAETATDNVRLLECLLIRVVRYADASGKRLSDLDKTDLKMATT